MINTIVLKNTPPNDIQKVVPKINPLNRLPMTTLMILTMIISLVPSIYKVIRAMILAKPILKLNAIGPIKIDSKIFKVIAIAHNNVKYTKRFVFILLIFL